jgi:hypothetical protein
VSGLWKEIYRPDRHKFWKNKVVKNIWTRSDIIQQFKFRLPYFVKRSLLREINEFLAILHFSRKFIFMYLYWKVKGNRLSGKYRVARNKIFVTVLKTGGYLSSTSLRILPPVCIQVAAYDGAHTSLSLRGFHEDWPSDRHINTGRFIMFFVITNIYNKKTKGPNLMEFFITTGNPKKFFFYH